MSIPLMCDTCQSWDRLVVRYRGKPESICRNPRSPDRGCYTIAYHTCDAHSALDQAARMGPITPTPTLAL